VLLAANHQRIAFLDDFELVEDLGIAFGADRKARADADIDIVRPGGIDAGEAVDRRCRWAACLPTGPCPNRRRAEAKRAACSGS
jgi:hypothetical protein